ncbi:hypothetical protein N7530_011441 [Penicillium desertorum]|uniref:Uncharacterized protein n=1 Tax=Penicillium desertorum TaxID=1303715 RepID=A0A9W9WD65_9EURO|nr:hypothetical protein N7530_012670 [Penicillium desertorum]KAJ5456167.1 hypothetical protein N7530_011441 [Penicillium desertorum]
MKPLSAICHFSDAGTVIRDLLARTTTSPFWIVFRIRQKFRGYMWLEHSRLWTGRPRPVYTLDQIALTEH